MKYLHPRKPETLAAVPRAGLSAGNAPVNFFVYANNGETDPRSRSKMPKRLPE